MRSSVEEREIDEIDNWSSDEVIQAVAEISAAKTSVEEAIGKRIVGQKSTIDSLLICLLAKGHCLFVGVPGLAKTLLISTLSELTDLTFSRIQFTPDLMPSDIMGTEILEEEKTTGKRSFRFVKGPVFANLVLADEINRTPPKTQAALLQSMQEGQVTVGGKNHILPDPFFVFATQNPIEQEGTYPLPEAQLDRFMFLVKVDYPSPEEELQILRTTTTGKQASVPKIFTPQQLLRMQKLVPRIPASQSVLKAAVSLVQRTRPSSPSAPDYIRKSVAWGAGPRASQFLVMGAKAKAILEGRFACTIEDIRSVAKRVLRHRIVLNFRGESEGITSDALVECLLKDL